MLTTLGGLGLGLEDMAHTQVGIIRTLMHVQHEVP